MSSLDLGWGGGPGSRGRELDFRSIRLGEKAPEWGICTGTGSCSPCSKPTSETGPASGRESKLHIFNRLQSGDGLAGGLAGSGPAIAFKKLADNASKQEKRVHVSKGGWLQGWNEIHDGSSASGWIDCGGRAALRRLVHPLRQLLATLPVFVPVAGGQFLELRSASGSVVASRVGRHRLSGAGRVGGGCRVGSNRWLEGGQPPAPTAWPPIACPGGPPERRSICSYR